MCVSMFKARMCYCSVLQKCGGLCAATTIRLLQHDRLRRLGGLRRGNSDTCRTKSVPTSLPFFFPVSLLIILGLNNVILIATAFFICFINRPEDSRYSIKNCSVHFFYKVLSILQQFVPVDTKPNGSFISASLGGRSPEITTVFSVILSLLTVSWELLKWSSAIKYIRLLRETNGTVAWKGLCLMM